jgi:hypothetical protein
MISPILSTSNGTSSFGHSDCSEGYLQFNVSSEDRTCIHESTNYTAALSHGVLTITRVFSAQDGCRRLKATVEVNSIDTSRRCHETWTFFAPPPTPTVKNAVSIQSRESGLCLDLPGGNTTNGNQLMVWECLGNKNQQWEFQELPVPRLVYAPSLESASPKCIDLMAGNTTNGQPLQIWDCAGTPQQTWAFEAKSGVMYLLSDASKCADLRNGGMKNSTAVQVWDCTAAPQGGLAIGWNQQWSLSSSESSKGRVGMNIIV